MERNQVFGALLVESCAFMYLVDTRVFAFVANGRPLIAELIQRTYESERLDFAGWRWLWGIPQPKACPRHCCASVPAQQILAQNLTARLRRLVTGASWERLQGPQQPPSFCAQYYRFVCTWVNYTGSLSQRVGDRSDKTTYNSDNLMDKMETYEIKVLGSVK